MDNSFDVGYYRIEEAVISNFNRTRQYDISQFIGSASFVESIHSPYLLGEIIIADAIDIFGNFRLRGEEILKMTYVDFFNTRITSEFIITAIHSLVPNEQSNAQSYRLSISTPITLMSSTQEIKKSYQGQFSETIRKIYNDYLIDQIHYPNSPTDIDVQETFGVHSIVIPALSPIEAIDFLRRKSFSSENASSNFLFFETRKGHKVITHEQLIRNSRAEDSNNFNTSNIYFYDPALNLDIEEKARAMNNIIEITFPTLINTQENIQSGAVISNTPTINILDKQFLNHVNKYSDNFDKSLYQKFDTNAIFPYTQEFVEKYFEDDNIVIEKPVFIDTSRSGLFYELIIPHRRTTDHFLNSISCEIKIPGRNDLNAGDILKLDIPQFDVDTNKKINRTLSGYWMVNSIAHTLHKNEYHMNVRLSKDSLKGSSNNGK